MFLRLIVSGIIIHTHGFKSQQCCNLPTHPCIEDLFLLISLVVLDNARTAPRCHTQLQKESNIIRSAVSYLCMPPVVLSGLCESLKSKCFSAQQKMPENTKGKDKADLVKECCQFLGCLDLHLFLVSPRNQPF